MWWPVAAAAACKPRPISPVPLIDPQIEIAPINRSASIFNRFVIRQSNPSIESCESSRQSSFELCCVSSRAHGVSHWQRRHGDAHDDAVAQVRPDGRVAAADQRRPVHCYAVAVPQHPGVVRVPGNKPARAEKKKPGQLPQKLPKNFPLISTKTLNFCHCLSHFMPISPVSRLFPPLLQQYDFDPIRWCGFCPGGCGGSGGSGDFDSCVTGSCVLFCVVLCFLVTFVRHFVCVFVFVCFRVVCGCC